MHIKLGMDILGSIPKEKRKVDLMPKASDIEWRNNIKKMNNNQENIFREGLAKIGVKKEILNRIYDKRSVHINLKDVLGIEIVVDCSGMTFKNTKVFIKNKLFIVMDFKEYEIEGETIFSLQNYDILDIENDPEIKKVVEFLNEKELVK